MKSVQLLVAALLLVFMGSVYAAKPTPVEEQNVDGSGDIKVAVQNTPANPVPVAVQGTIDANITGGELDVNVVSAAPCEAPLRYQFVGFSEQDVDGSWGVLFYTRMCQETYGPTARMCNSLELMETVAVPRHVGTEGWVRPVFLGNGYSDVSGIAASGPNLSCNGWLKKYDPWDDPYTGLKVSGDGHFFLDLCYNQNSATCCAPVQ